MGNDITESLNRLIGATILGIFVPWDKKEHEWQYDFETIVVTDRGQISVLSQWGNTGNRLSLSFKTIDLSKMYNAFPNSWDIENISIKFRRHGESCKVHGRAIRGFNLRCYQDNSIQGLSIDLDNGGVLFVGGDYDETHPIAITPQSTKTDSADEKDVRLASGVQGLSSMHEVSSREDAQHF